MFSTLLSISGTNVGRGRISSKRLGGCQALSCEPIGSFLALTAFLSAIGRRRLDARRA